jgi:NDP-hexose 3,5-(Or5-) epimerase
MDITRTRVLDAFRIRPTMHEDLRGRFYESFRRDELERATGRRFTPVQTNFSTSRRNVLRGMHGVTIPPGQAKFVTCVRGQVMDVTLDTRTGSPTFGEFDTNILDEGNGTAVFIPEGLAHGFVALTDNACVSYVCSTLYVPGTPYEVNPFDPDIAIPWNVPAGECILAPKDSEAPTLAAAAAAGVLPTYAECVALYRRLTDAPAA